MFAENRFKLNYTLNNEITMKELGSAVNYELPHRSYCKRWVPHYLFTIPPKCSDYPACAIINSLLYAGFRA